MPFIGLKKIWKKTLGFCSSLSGISLKRGFASGIDRQANWLAHSLHSRAAFVWLVYGTAAWIPFVAFGLDPHGFLYLYIATSLSLVTQVPLAMLAYWAAQEAGNAEVLTRQMLQNQTDMMKMLLVQVGEADADIERIMEMGQRSLNIRMLRDRMLAREEHMIAVRGLVEALEAGLDEGGLPPEVRRSIYKRIDREYQKWEKERLEGEKILERMVEQDQMTP